MGEVIERTGKKSNRFMQVGRMSGVGEKSEGEMRTRELRKKMKCFPW